MRMFSFPILVGGKVTRQLCYESSIILDISISKNRLILHHHTVKHDAKTFDFLEIAFLFESHFPRWR